WGLTQVNIKDALREKDPNAVKAALAAVAPSPEGTPPDVTSYSRVAEWVILLDRFGLFPTKGFRLQGVRHVQDGGDRSLSFVQRYFTRWDSSRRLARRNRLQQEEQ